MATNYITKSFNKNGSLVSADSGKLAQRFDTMIKNVKQMVKEEGPIYHTWISFQVGGYDDPVIFNTDTTNPNQNCIATLTIDKTGADVANSFTLQVIFDLFNYGQESTNQIEKLDLYLANALSYNIENDDTLKGYLQYGYVSTSTDLDLSSPFYSYYITDAKSNINTASGIAQYTFEGVTTISKDCEFSANIEKYDTNWKLLDVVEWTIFYHYGDNEHKPANTIGTCKDNEYKYRIDIPQDLYDQNKELTVGYVNDNKPLDATNINPIKYVEELLEKFPLTKSEMDSGVWNNWQDLSYNKRPRYDWYITDDDGVKTWHLTHYCPGVKNSKGELITEEMDIKTGDYNYELSEPITWGLQDKNIVINWAPQVDLKPFIIRQASYQRAQQQLNNSSGEVNLDSITDEEIKQDIKEAVENNTIRQEASIVQEYYDATITLLGIPAAPPVNMRMKIIPRILESISRTQGTYLIKKCSDKITNRGVYTTELELFRVDNIDESYANLQKQIQEQEKEKQNVSENGTTRVYTDLYNYEDVSTEEAKIIQDRPFKRETGPSAAEELEGRVKLVQ